MAQQRSDQRHPSGLTNNRHRAGDARVSQCENEVGTGRAVGRSRSLVATA